MTAAAAVVSTVDRPLAYLPVALFGSVMGLTGLAVAWRLAHLRYGIPESISQCIGALAVIAFVLVAGGYTRYRSSPSSFTGWCSKLPCLTPCSPRP